MYRKWYNYKLSANLRFWLSGLQRTTYRQAAVSSHFLPTVRVHVVERFSKWTFFTNRRRSSCEKARRRQEVTRKEKERQKEDAKTLVTQYITRRNVIEHHASTIAINRRILAALRDSSTRVCHPWTFSGNINQFVRFLAIIFSKLEYFVNTFTHSVFWRCTKSENCISHYFICSVFVDPSVSNDIYSMVLEKNMVNLWNIVIYNSVDFERKRKRQVNSLKLNSVSFSKFINEIIFIRHDEFYYRLVRSAKLWTRIKFQSAAIAALARDQLANFILFVLHGLLKELLVVLESM